MKMMHKLQGKPPVLAKVYNRNDKIAEMNHKSN